MSELPYPASVPAPPASHGGLVVFPTRAPALVRCVNLLWKHRLLVVVGTLLPAALITLLLWLWPRRYTATLVYDRPLSEREYSVLERRFHSRENLDKMIAQLRTRGLARYARDLDQVQTEESFERLIRFAVAPMYPKRLLTTDPCTSERISTFQARLLLITVTGHSPDEVAGASAVVTGNLENVLPLYDIRNALKESMQKLKDDTAEIEAERFTLTLDLAKENAKLEKFKTLGAAPAEAGETGMVVQFTDVEKSQEYLPLAYQVRAVQSKIIDLQETLRSDAEKYNYYLQILELDDKLLAQVEGSLLTDYTVKQFLTSLGEQLQASKSEAITDYLKSCLRKTENLVLVNTRAGEKPVVYPLARHVIQGGLLAGALFLMVAALVAVLLESRGARPSLPGAPS